MTKGLHGASGRWMHVPVKKGGGMPYLATHQGTSSS